MTNKTKKIFGIDSLYYYKVSNNLYNELLNNIENQIEEKIQYFENNNLTYEYKDIVININNSSFNYLGKNMGFTWLRDSNEYFRIGFKGKKINPTQHSTRVQLQAVGIYTIGIKSLIEHIDELLKEYCTLEKPITRADLNCFIQYDFKFLKKDMFVTKKKTYSTINEIGNANETQTITIGKAPFKLRIYDKRLELKSSEKKELMDKYFFTHGFNLHDPVSNVEFELHRAYLKTFNILDVQDLLCNANKLFKDCMDQIKLIDVDSISDNAIKNNNKHRAEVLPIWKDIKDEYCIDNFIQNDSPLRKFKREKTIYDDYKFEKEFKELIRKAFTNRVPMDQKYLFYLYKDAVLHENKNKDHIEQLKDNFIDIDFIDSEGKIHKFVQNKKTNEIVKALEVKVHSKLSDDDLCKYYKEIKKNKDDNRHSNSVFYLVEKEMVKRRLLHKPEEIEKAKHILKTNQKLFDTFRKSI